MCVAYEHEGDRLADVPFHQSVFHHVTPVYETLPGWACDLSGCGGYAALPKEARAYVEWIEDRSGVPVDIVSIGPGRSQTLLRDP